MKPLRIVALLLEIAAVSFGAHSLLQRKTTEFDSSFASGSWQGKNAEFVFQPNHKGILRIGELSHDIQYYTFFNTVDIVITRADSKSSNRKLEKQYGGEFVEDGQQLQISSLGTLRGAYIRR